MATFASASRAAGMMPDADPASAAKTSRAYEKANGAPAASAVPQPRKARRLHPDGRACCAAKPPRPLQWKDEFFISVAPESLLYRCSQATPRTGRFPANSDGDLLAHLLSDFNASNARHVVSTFATPTGRS